MPTHIGLDLLAERHATIDHRQVWRPRVSSSWRPYSLGRWRTSLSPEMQVVANREFGDVLEQFGYDV